MKTTIAEPLHPMLVLLCAVLLSITSACSNDGSSSVTVQQQNTGTINMPVGINAANLPADGSLHAYIRVDDQARQELTVDLGGNTISGSISGISNGIHTFVIEVVFTYDSGTEVMLATASKQLDVSTGDNNLTIVSSDYVTNFDSDNDGLTNLEEINNGTPPVDPACVLGTSMLGSCSLG